MGIFFEDKAFEFETVRTLNYYNFQGAELGEIQAIVHNIQEGDFDSWYKAWYAMAEKVSKLAEGSLRGNHNVSAREAYLRASNYYRTAEFFLKNDEPVRLECYGKSVSTFRKAMQLMTDRWEQIDIPFENGYLSSYLYTAGKDAPTLIFIGGYDSTVEELYFAGGEAARKRGFNVLIFDGPGQGEALRIQKMVARFDFEKPVSAALDYLEAHTEINTQNFVALLGMSLGGYYAARTAAFEKRIDACVLFDVFTDVWESITQKNPLFRNLDSNPAIVQKVDPSKLDGNTRWLIQNGLWVLGAGEVAELPSIIKKFTVKDIAEHIDCPTLLLVGTHDHFASDDQLTYLKDHLKTYEVHIFDTEFGAQEHCQEGNHSHAHQVIFDWVEEQLQKYKDA